MSGRSYDVHNVGLSLTISGPSSQKAVRESARVKGMVKLQRRRSLMARLITKIFRGVLIAFNLKVCERVKVCESMNV